MATTRKPVVIVTGASRGIGLAVTKHLLHKFNAQVVALARTQTPELVELTSPDLLFIQCDVADEPALTAAVEQARSNFHHIDGLILNAAVVGPLCRIGDDTPLAAWKTHFDVNFFSLVTALRATLPSLRKSDFGGRVIFVSSGSAVMGNPGFGPYSASKAAMNGLCRTLAEEEPNVVSIAIRPGMVDTDMNVTVRRVGNPHMTETDYNNFVRLYTEGKLLKSESPGHVIAALGLRAPKSLSGQFISWDSEECKEFRA
ncbi:short-chain dehydrogenase [Infundibulicybe gibba]|nr:short-chain dehydrogenase [Infundibulicybe gibba]